MTNSIHTLTSNLINFPASNPVGLVHSAEVPSGADQERADRFERILRRRRRRQVHQHGFAPDLVHGSRRLDAIYEVVGARRAEGMLMVTELELGGEASVLTLGRWREGFLDLVQVVVRPGEVVGAQALMAVMDLMEGAVEVLGTTGGALRALRGWLTQAGQCDELACVLLPLAGSRAELLEREEQVLGLVREDMATCVQVQALAPEWLIDEDPMAQTRLLDAGRADALTCAALYVERLLSVS